MLRSHSVTISAGCPVGMFMSDTKQDCEACPIGSYQDAANSVDCKPCPTDTNTTGTGSDSLQQCRCKLTLPVVSNAVLVSNLPL